MWKLIIILVLLLYLLNKISVIIFRMFGKTQQPPFKGTPSGDPGANAKPQKKAGLKGGEYVDYEEVK